MFIKLNTNKETAGTLKALGVLLNNVADNTPARATEEFKEKIVDAMVEKLEEIEIGFPQPEVAARTEGHTIHATVSTPMPLLDSAGVIWNPEIHSATRAKNKDGTWRGRRNVEKSVAPEINTSLAPTMPEGINFSNVLQLITKCIETGKLTKAQILQILNSFDIPSVAVLSNYPQHFVALNTRFNEVLNG